MNRRQKALMGSTVLLTCVVLLVCLVSLLDCVGKPFPGFFYEANRVVCPAQGEGSTGAKAGLCFYDLIVAVDGQPLQSIDALKSHVKALPCSTPVTYRVQRDGKSLDLRIPTQMFTWQLFGKQVVPWILASTLALILGGLVVWRKPNDRVAWVHFAFCISLALVGATNIETAVTHRFSLLNQMGLVALGMTGLHLSVLFPVGLKVFRPPYRQLWCYLPAILIPLIPICYPHPGLWGYCFAVIMTVSSTGMLAIVLTSFLASVLPSTSPLVRRQALVILFGSFLTTVPTVLSYALTMLGYSNFALPFADLFLTALPLAIAFAILRYRLFDIETIIKRTLLYSITFGILCSGYLLLLIGLRFLVGRDWELPTSILATTIIAVLYDPLRTITRAWLGRLFCRGGYDARRVMVDFSDYLLQTSDPDAVAAWYIEALDEALQPKWIGIYRGEAHLSLWQSRGEELPGSLELGEYPWKDACLYPLLVREETLGLVALGPKRSELAYRVEDLELIKNLTQQMALWLRSARLFLEIAEREHQQVEALREADRMKDEFLSVVSHELRTPFNAIQGFGEVLDSELLGPLNERQHTAIAKMLAGSDKILGLINDILDFTQIRAGMFRILPKESDYPAMVARVLDCLQSLWKSKQLVVTTSLEVDRLVVLDVQRIEQVLTNLVANAIKFTPEGGSIHIRACCNENGLVTEVSDTGIGISPEDLPKLFAPFQQLDMSYTRREGGTGLGLSICRGIIDVHGGTIEVTSSGLGCGTTFRYSLPLATSAVQADSPQICKQV